MRVSFVTRGGLRAYTYVGDGLVRCDWTPVGCDSVTERRFIGAGTADEQIAGTEGLARRRPDFGIRIYR